MLPNTENGWYCVALTSMCMWHSQAPGARAALPSDTLESDTLVGMGQGDSVWVGGRVQGSRKSTGVL